MLNISKVPRALENKTTIFGFEISELILVFLYLSITNFFFGRTGLKIPFVWGGTIALGVGILLTRRKRPDQFLQHLYIFYRNPEILSAGERDREFVPYLNPNLNLKTKNEKGTRK